MLKSPTEGAMEVPSKLTAPLKVISYPPLNQSLLNNSLPVSSNTANPSNCTSFSILIFNPLSSQLVTALPRLSSTVTATSKSVSSFQFQLTSIGN